MICYEEDTEECHLEDLFVPDARSFDLPEDFIFIENKWGSLFYKHLGKMPKNDAKTTCLSFGPSVHLPKPRFLEEFKFYSYHFGFDDSPYNDSKGL